LPVIVTPNCGKVVEDGVTGFLVPPRDSRTLALAISRFIDEPALTVKMSSQCAAAAQAFSIDAYGKLLVEVIERRMSARRRTA
jgi:glycosyltransferase involved in cell wall biosynthesis